MQESYLSAELIHPQPYHGLVPGIKIVGSRNLLMQCQPAHPPTLGDGLNTYRRRFSDLLALVHRVPLNIGVVCPRRALTSRAVSLWAHEAL